MNLTIAPEALELMRSRNRDGARWAAYHDQELTARNKGMRFLHVGQGCTHTTPPQRHPDTATEILWRFGFVGWANTETGLVELETKRG